MTPTASLLASIVTNQILFFGLVTGLVYGLLAMGIVLIYRSTKVINFAVGNMGLPGAALFALLMINWDFPFWPALIACLVLGAVIGATLEIVVVKRLFTRPRVVLLIATVGISELMRGVVFLYPDVDGEPGETYPTAIGSSWDGVLGWLTSLTSWLPGVTGDDGLRVSGPELQILVVVPLVAVGLGWVLTRTTFGLSILASADNPSLSRLAGINPHVVSTVVWAVAGLLSTLTMILLSAGRAPVGIENLGPFTLLNALAAAVLARMRSFPQAMAFGIAIGVGRNIVNLNVDGEPGLDVFLVFLAILTALYWQSRGGGEAGVLAFAPRARPIPEHLRGVWWIRHIGRIVGGSLLVAVVVVTWQHVAIFEWINGVQSVWQAPDRILPSQFLLYSTIVGFAICAASLTVITGWSGQLSLAQMAYAGIGALTAAALNRGIELDIGYGENRFLDVEWAGIPTIPSIIGAALLTALVAALTGVAALRVPGLFLAISTFAFAIAAEEYLYARPLLSDGGRSVLFDRGRFLWWDLQDQRSYFWFVLACLVVTITVLARLRRSGFGRSVIAVRDNADAAAAYTVSPTRMKLMAFALAGGTAGLGGALLGNAVRQIRPNDALFRLEDSLSVVNMTVIGGLGSVVGPVLGALWIEGLPTFFPDNDGAVLVSGSIGFLVILMYFPGGFIEISYRARDGIIGWADQRVTGPSRSQADTAEPARGDGVRPHRSARVVPPVRGGRGVALDAATVSVRFGARVAVHRASIRVGQDEIVGLIGTNGAGKSTLMNAIGGFVPAVGRIELLGEDVSSRSAHERARRGLGRTFQAATLFPELTVRETIQVGLEARHRSSILRSALLLDGRFERRQRSDADDIIGLLGLGRYADAAIADLSTGTRRIVGIGGLLAVGATVLCLDEPTAGVAQRETEAFGPLLLEIRRELGASMLIIEHDMPLIMSISDRVYCLEAGSVLAEGTPAAVRHAPQVISSYLGTDDRAIDRSDASKPADPG